MQNYINNCKFLKMTTYLNSKHLAEYDFLETRANLLGLTVFVYF